MRDDSLSSVPFNDDELRYFASRDCCLVLTNRVIFHTRTRGEGKERIGKSRKNIRGRVGKKPKKGKNPLSISSDKITTNGPQPFLLFFPPFTRPDATRPIPFACRRLLVCFFSPSFPSETSSADPSARESSSFDSSGDQGTPPVKQNICLPLKFVPTINSGSIIPRKSI